MDYDTGEITSPTHYDLSAPEPQWTKSNGRYVFAGWGAPGAKAVYLPISAEIALNYLYGNETTAVAEFFPMNALVVELAANTAEHAVPSSIRADFTGHTLIDRDGAVIADPTPSGGGTVIGTVDYASARLTLTQWWEGLTNSATLANLLTTLGNDTTDAWSGRAPSFPVKSLQFTIRATTLSGDELTATADANGALTASGIEGKLDYRIGVYTVRFGAWVTASGQQAEHWYDSTNVVNGQAWQPLPVLVSTIRTDCVTVLRLAMRADVTGIDPSRLPPDGNLPHFREDDLIAIHHAASVVVTTPVAGATLNVGRENLDSVWVRDADGVRVPADRFVSTEDDLAAGFLHWADPLDTTGYPTPWTVYHRIWEIGTVGDKDSFNAITLRDKGLEQGFPEGSYVSSLLYIGDMQASVSVPFFQSTWTGVWSDTAIGTVPLAAYDFYNFPIEVSNRGTTIKAQVAFIFHTTTLYDCVIRGFKTLNTGISIHSDYAPINPATGEPYFTVHGAPGDDGPFGTGWAAGYVMRFNLTPAAQDVKFLKCLQPSAPQGLEDVFEFEFRGDIDRP